MELSDFDFDLPEELIALRPVRPRTAARLLVARGDRTEHAHVHDLPRLLRRGDLLVFNDTRVLPARLTGERRRESPHGAGIARIEATLIRRESEADWRALVRPAKRLRKGDVIRFGEGLTAEVAALPEQGETQLRFDRAGAELDAALATAGVMPLPPYIAQRRPADAEDAADYQTVFATRPGAVAAPTAALHFDEALLKALTEAGVGTVRLTLHVGAGTFLPVKDLGSHRMHAEWGELTPEAAATINAVRRAGGRVIPVGTTALRLIESAADPSGNVQPWQGDTDIFIKPGYLFRVTDGLMTNFHLPRSTLVMLVAALMGRERTLELYRTAITEEYRFYSYGDSSLLFPE